MRSEAKVANSTMRGPVAPASRILSASASVRYSFFCGRGVGRAGGHSAQNRGERAARRPVMVMDRMGHLKDSDFGELRSGLRGKSASISSF